MLSIINNQYKLAQFLNRSSPDLFNSLPIVILMGDFFQFPPIRGPPLWKDPRPGNKKDTIGQLIWHQFKNIVILIKQMRQAEDPSFCEYLSQTRQTALREDNVTRLNSRIITSLVEPDLDDAIVIVKLNAVRHPINRIRIENFA
jgi:hypothetical protein